MHAPSIKNIFLILLLGAITTIYSQAFQDPFQDYQKNSFDAGLGMTWIDGSPYTTITLAPELTFGKFGVGLYLQFLMDNDNNFKLRKDEYEGGAGILRAIRYIRYGKKYDPLYLRLGVLEMATLGNGLLMWNYNNVSNYDERKLGLIADVDFGKFGFESVTSNLNQFELLGGSLYFRPFRYFMPEAPILKNTRVHGTYIKDRNAKTGALLDSTNNLKAWGFGADIQWLNLPILKSFIFGEYGKFIDFGSGKSIGISAIIPEFWGLFAVAAKFEKRFINQQFIPSFFGPLYELNRNLDPFSILKSAPKTEGYFAQLAGHLIHRVRLIGSFQRLNGVENSGIIHLEALAPHLIPSFEIRAYYDKFGIETFEDVRTLDSRSISTVEVGYRLNRFLLLTMIYRWYWIESVNEFGITEYKPIERVEPRLSFSYNF